MTTESYPWFKFVTGEWERVTDLGARVARREGHRTLEDAVAAAPDHLKDSTFHHLALSLVGAAKKWTQGRNYRVHTRIDRHARTVEVRFVPKLSR